MYALREWTLRQRQQTAGTSASTSTLRSKQKTRCEPIALPTSFLSSGERGRESGNRREVQTTSAPSFSPDPGDFLFSSTVSVWNLGLRYVDFVLGLANPSNPIGHPASGS